MKVADFKLTNSDFGTFGQGLHRPECVWIDSDGIWASDERGGVALVHKDRNADLLGGGIIEANGYSRRPDGSFVVAGLGDGGVHIISPDGSTRVLLNERDSVSLGAVNCACADGNDRVWVSIMTRKSLWHLALSSPSGDGYILRIDNDGKNTKIVAESLDLINELKISPDGKYMYAAESLACRIVRFSLNADGSLGPKEIVGPASLGHGAFPDGFAFDPYGNLWVTIISHNGLYVIDRDGNLHVVYSDIVEEAVEGLAQSVLNRNSSVEQLGACASLNGPLRLPTSLAFGGPDGRTAYIGSLLMPHLATFRIPEYLE